MLRQAQHDIGVYKLLLLSVWACRRLILSNSATLRRAQCDSESKVLYDMYDHNNQGRILQIESTFQSKLPHFIIKILKTYILKYYYLRMTTSAEQLFTAVLYRLKLITRCSLRNELNHFIQK
jgi:hypothetical protein